MYKTTTLLLALLCLSYQSALAQNKSGGMQNAKIPETRDNNDRKADRREVVATVEDAHGLAIHDNRLYIVNNMEIHAADIREDGTFGDTE